MMRRTILFSLGLGALVSLAPEPGVAQDRVRIELGPPSQMAPQVMLSPQPVVAPETLQVDGITANQVQARTIYANRIAADRVRGNIYQTAGVQNLYGHGQINATDVAASVIYADTINANVVVAD